MSKGRKSLVAIIDDDIDIVVLFHGALGRIGGIKVLKFTDPTIALEHIRIYKQDYKLVITDQRMPAISGIELINLN